MSRKVKPSSQFMTVILVMYQLNLTLLSYSFSEPIPPSLYRFPPIIPTKRSLQYFLAVLSFHQDSSVNKYSQSLYQQFLTLYTGNEHLERV